MTQIKEVTNEVLTLTSTFSSKFSGSEVPDGPETEVHRMTEEFFELCGNIKQGVMDDLEIQEDICKFFS